MINKGTKTCNSLKITNSMIPTEDEVNEIFDILDVEARLDYETLYEGFEEMMCYFKPGKELLLRILTRTLEDTTRRLKSITQEKE